MNVSKQQEEQYLQDNSKAVWKIVNTFRVGMKYQTSDDDLYQEGMIALLAHMRKSATKDELDVFPSLEIKNAICRFLIAQEAVRFPKTRTTDYSKMVKQTRRVHIEKLLVSADPTQSDDNWIERIDMERYLMSLSERDRDMVLMRAHGHKTTEIA